jgi:hypothetical protein
MADFISLEFDAGGLTAGWVMGENFSRVAAVLVTAGSSKSFRIFSIVY